MSAESRRRKALVGLAVAGIAGVASITGYSCNVKVKRGVDSVILSLGEQLKRLQAKVFCNFVLGLLCFTLTSKAAHRMFIHDVVMLIMRLYYCSYDAPWGPS